MKKFKIINDRQRDAWVVKAKITTNSFLAKNERERELLLFLSV